MVAIPAAASAVSAYQREASRLVVATPPVGGKVITRDAGLSLGPFSLRYTATDYEFDLSGPLPQTSFTEALDAAATQTRLSEAAANDGETPPSANPLQRRLALSGYRAAAATARPVRASMFQAVG